MGFGNVTKKNQNKERAFHLKTSPNQIGKYAILPGDPKRVLTICKQLLSMGGSYIDIDNNNSIEESEYFISNREFTTITLNFHNTKVTITSSGIGGPSTSIAVEELFKQGVKTIIRVGTTGSIQKNVKVGDLIVTIGAVRFDGASKDLAPIEYPAVAHPMIVMALLSAADKYINDNDTNYHIGITASTDTFYQGQNRKDTYSGYLLNRFENSTKELVKLNVLNYEMESATLLTQGMINNCRCCAVEGVIVNRTISEIPDQTIINKIEEKTIQIALLALKEVIEWDQNGNIVFSIKNNW